MENNEIFETENVEFVDATVVEDEKGINPAIIAGAVAGGLALVGGGVVAAKKFGGKAKEKLMDAREARLLKKQQKLDAKVFEIQEKKVADKESEEK